MRKHRLKAKGLCQQGIIPDFYGVIERIDLQTLPPPWQPYPCAFLKDKLLPPPPTPSSSSTSPTCAGSTCPRSQRRGGQNCAILREIHAAGVYHGDLYPRNMMVQVQEGESGEERERVLLIDFDRAQTFLEDLDAIPPRQREWIEEENEMIDWFVENLVGACLRRTPRDYHTSG